MKSTNSNYSPGSPSLSQQSPWKSLWDKMFLDKLCFKYKATHSGRKSIIKCLQINESKRSSSPSCLPSSEWIVVVVAISRGDICSRHLKIANEILALFPKGNHHLCRMWWLGACTNWLLASIHHHQINYKVLGSGVFLGRREPLLDMLAL